MSKALGAALLAVVALGFGPGVPAPANSLVLVDPARNAIVGRIPLEGEPLRVSYGDGVFWVVLPHAGTIVRVNPESSVATRIRVGEEPFDVAVGANALWVADHDAERLFRIDLKTGKVRKTRNLGAPQLAVAYGFGAVWVAAADDALRRVDPRTMAITGTIENATNSVEGFEPKIAVGRDSLWISDVVTESVVRIDPRRVAIAKRVKKGGYGVAVGSGGVWSASGFTAVWRVWPAPPVQFTVLGNPVDVATGFQTVWAAARFGHALVRVEPRLRILTRLGREPVAVAAGGRHVAVVVR